MQSVMNGNDESIVIGIFLMMHVHFGFLYDFLFIPIKKAVQPAVSCMAVPSLCVRCAFYTFF